MKIRIYANHATLTLDDGEALQQHALELAVRKIATETAVWSVALESPTPVSDTDTALLRDIGFVVAGTTSTQSRTSIVWQKAIRRSGDGGGRGDLIDPNLAVPAPVMAPTNEETRAVTTLHEDLNKRFSPDAIERRVAALENDAVELRRLRGNE